MRYMRNSGRMHEVQAQELEHELFGGAEAFLDRLSNDAQDHIIGDDGNISIDTYLRDASTVEDIPTQAQVKVKHAVATGVGIAKRKDEGKRKPVWEEEEDESIMVDIAARPQLRKLRREECERLVGGVLLVYLGVTILVSIMLRICS
jgi:hypothetical protein